MPHWLIKSATHRIFSFLPWSHRWNELLQVHVSKSAFLHPAQFEQRLSYCAKHLDNFHRLHAAPGQGFAAFELGTGWFPVVPLGLYLCGATEIFTADIAPHLHPSRIRRAAELICDYARRNLLQQLLPRLRSDRVAEVQKLLDAGANATSEALLKRLNIHVLVRDAQDTGLKPGSIGLFVSNGVLEYIPRPILSNILDEFRRVARPGAVTSHFINLGDEFAQFDHSITGFNFLKYPDSRWKWLDSPLTSKSRLRISDYRQVFQETGWPITIEEDMNGDAADLEKVRLAPQFQKYSRADLLVLRAWVAARMVEQH